LTKLNFFFLKKILNLDKHMTTGELSELSNFRFYLIFFFLNKVTSRKP